MSLGQRSRSQPALKFRAFQIHVRPITSSCIVGFENYLAEMIMSRRYVACKTYVPRSKVKVTADTLSLGIPKSCPTQYFIQKKLVRFGLNIFISYYNYTSIQIYMKIIQAMGLERKLKAYKVLLPKLVRFENVFAEMIITTRRCVVCKNHVA